MKATKLNEDLNRMLKLAGVLSEGGFSSDGEPVFDEDGNLDYEHNDDEDDDDHLIGTKRGTNEGAVHDNGEWPIIHPDGTIEWFGSKETAVKIMMKRPDYIENGCRVASKNDMMEIGKQM